MKQSEELPLASTSFNDKYNENRVLKQVSYTKHKPISRENKTLQS